LARRLCGLQSQSGSVANIKIHNPRREPNHDLLAHSLVAIPNELSRLLEKTKEKKKDFKIGVIISKT
jgi:hypothetical protein